MLGNLKGKAREPSPNLVSSRLVYRALGEMINRFLQSGRPTGSLQRPYRGKASGLQCMKKAQLETTLKGAVDGDSQEREVWRLATSGNRIKAPSLQLQSR